MNKWKITQIFINLPPQKQVVAGLLFTVLTLASAIVYYEYKILNSDREHKADVKLLNAVITSEREQNVYLQNRYLDFMEREINTRFQFKNQIDSLKIKTVKK